MQTIYILKGTKNKVVKNSLVPHVVAELLINDIETINNLKSHSYKHITTFRKINGVKTKIKVFYTLYENLLKIKNNITQ